MQSGPNPFRQRSLAAALLLVLTILRAAGASPATPPVNAGESPILDAAMATVRASMHPYGRAKAAIAVAEAYARFGLRHKAHEAFAEAVSCALDSSAPDHLVFQAGASCVRVGLYDQAVEIAAKVSNPARATNLVIDTALARLEAGQRQEALLTLAHARSRLDDIEALDLATRTLGKLGRAYWDAGESRQFDVALSRTIRNANEVEEDSSRNVLLEYIASVYAGVGRFQDAVNTALIISSPQVRVPRLLAIAESCGEAGEDQQAMDILKVAGQQAASIDDAYTQALMLALVADAYRAAGRNDMARAALQDAEQAAARIQDPQRVSIAHARLVATYISVGDLRAAGRLIGDIAEPMRRSRQTVHLAVRHAVAGEHEQALRILDKAEPRYIALAGTSKLKAIAEAYYHTWGKDAAPKKSERLEPGELADAVLARYAEGWIAQKDYGQAITFARAIRFVVTRDDALMTVARRCLAAEASVESAAPAFEVLDLLSGRIDRLKLRALLAEKYVQVGRADDALEALGRLAEDVASEPSASARTELLGRTAVAFHKLGRRQEAGDTAAKAMAAALKVGCASCRDDVIEDLFEHLSGADYVELALAAADRLELPRVRAENFARMFEMGAGLTREQQERLLREALTSASRIAVLAARIELLLRVAAHYRDVGLEVTQSEREMLRASYELPVVAAQALEPGRGAPVRLVYFYRPNCPGCEEARAALDELRSVFPALDLETFDLSVSESAALLNQAICEALSIPEQQRLVAPSVFSMKKGLIGSEVSPSTLAELAGEARGLPSPAIVFASRVAEARSDLARSYEDLGVVVVVSAGLLDGINPCAFTVIIFFVSYLAYMGRDKREVAVVGIVFTAAVFATYFAIGMGLVGLLSVAEAWSLVFRKVLYGVTAVLVLVAAILSLRDGIRCLKGQTASLTLSLPAALRSKIRLTISRRARLGLTIAATAGLGAIVALFEFPCTGQIYVPVAQWIAFALRHLPRYEWGPVGWLLLYNICFVMPLIAVFVAVFFGLSSEKLTAFFRRHIAKTKFAMAALFAVLFIVMTSYLV